MNALIGHTGFVGGNILLQDPSIEALFNSKNIESIVGQHFSKLYCAGAPGVKWLANKEPEKDLAQIQKLIDSLKKTNVEKCILISTIDVYPRPIEVDEDTRIPEDNHAYGRHRLLLEQFVQQHFPSLIVRLPALFGPSLKKNVIFDFLHDNNLNQIHQDGVFQFYNIEYLLKDISIALENNLTLLNIATEPVGVRELVDGVFKNGFNNDRPDPAPRYDYRSKHAEIWSGKTNYQYSKEAVLADIAAFVHSQKKL